MPQGMNPRILLFGGLLVLLVVLFSVGRGGNKTSTTDKTKHAAALQTYKLVGTTETAYRAKTGKYTGNVADLVELDKNVLADPYPLDIRLQASTDGKTYYLQLTAETVTLTQAKTLDKVVAHTCVLAKSKSGLPCPSS
jgi:hypothetical protein